MKTLKSYFVKKWLLCVPPMLALCLIIACSDDDKKDPITPDALAIESFSPPKGEVGTEITVIGTGFSTVSSENTVTLGTTPVSLNMVEAGKLKFNVPEGASSGKINVSVGTESVTSSATFTVEDPQPEMTITGIDPMEGEWDTYVVIDGNNFAPANNVVLFNGVMAEVFQESTSQITVTVPEDSRSGKIEVRDPIDDRSALTAEDFTVFHGRWTQIADFGGGARVNAMTFTLNNSGLVGLGVDSEFVHKADFWRYSPESDNWNKEDNDYGGKPRYFALGFVIGEDAFLGFGA
ncbi:MAG: IPT/TIG domain-containing protein, partial [Allomuricauda sp.]